MKSRMILSGAVLIVQLGFAQCGMTVQLSAYMDCGIGQLSVNTTGGTGPFTVLIERAFPAYNDLVELITNDLDGDLDRNYGSDPVWLATTGVSVTVTDALNCEVVATQAHAPYNARTISPLPATLDCASGTFKLTMLLSWELTELGDCRIDNGPLIPYTSWVPTGQWQVYRLDQPLVPGYHSIAFPEHMSSYGVRLCQVSFDLTIPQSITPGDCGVNVRVRAALGGALTSGTLMNDGLRTANLIPLMEPYSAAGYVYTGSSSGASTTSALLSATGNDGIVDWVIVEFRSAASPYTVLHSRPALLQRDGDVVSMDGRPYINSPLSPGSYRIAIRHRNHLGVMSGAYALGVDPTNTLVDLRLQNTPTYGTNARMAVGAIQCLWPGDANSSGTVQYTGIGNDRDPVLVAIGGSVATNTVTNIYSPLDINMNGTISYTGLGNDRDVILQAIGGVVATATRTQQLP